MTNEQVIEMQRRHQRLSERSKTIQAELRGAGNLETQHSQLCLEALEVINWLQEQNAALRKELKEEIREQQEAIRDAYTDGMLDAARESGEW